MVEDNKSTKSKKSVRTTTEGALKINPYGFAQRMIEDHGLRDYQFRKRDDPALQKALGLAATDIPSNFAEIEQVLSRERDDLPSHESFCKLSRRAMEVAIGPDEGDVQPIFELFIDVDRWDRQLHGHGRKTLLIPQGMLPEPQSKIKPDMCLGLDSSALRKRSWLAKHTPGYVRNCAFISVNGIVEYKSAEGSIPAARISNQAAAVLLCNSWLEDEETLNSISDFTSAEAAPPAANQNTSARAGLTGSMELSRAEQAVVGKAFVGSICFDGNIIEASVHWLDDSSIIDGRRRYDVFSLRVAGGLVFATNLREYHETYRKIANFMDWMLSARIARLERIMALPPVEPAAIARPEPDYEASDSEEAKDDDGDDDGDEGPSTSNSQPLRDLSLQSFGGAAGDDAGARGSQQQQQQQGGKEKRRNFVANAAQTAKKRLKQTKR